MTNGKSLSIGGKFIDRGEVFRVFKIEKKEVEGKIERIIYYRPFYTNPMNGSLTCSIPESSLKNVNVRAPVSRKEMNELLGNLVEISGRRDSPDRIEAKSILSLNDIHRTVAVLKIFWGEKRQKGSDFSQTGKDILNLAIDKIVEEVALVIGLTLDEAREEIISALNKRRPIPT